MSAHTHKTLRRWAFAAGYTEQELDAAAQRMHSVIRDEVLREAAAKIRAWAQPQVGNAYDMADAFGAADLIDPDKEN